MEKENIKRTPVGNLNPNLPPDLQTLFAKNNERIEKETSTGPKLVATGNKKLDELLEIAKELTSTYEEIILPSLGKFYDGEELPSDGILHVRRMTGQEEEILATQRHLKKGQALDMIFKNCIRENVKVEKMLSVDRYYLLVFLRGISYTNQYDVNVRCPECESKIEWSVDLDNDISVDYCADDFTASNLKDELPATKFKFSYHFATGQDEKMIEQYVNRKNKKENESNEDTFLYRSSVLINEIEGMSDKNDIMTLLRRLPTMDSTYLRNVLTDPPFGLNSKIQIECDNCFEKFEVEMPQGASFFSPDLRKVKKIHP